MEVCTKSFKRARDTYKTNKNARNTDLGVTMCSLVGEKERSRSFLELLISASDVTGAPLPTFCSMGGKYSPPESIEWFIEDQTFSPLPLPPLSTGATQEHWQRETTCWWERGWGRSQIIRPQESLVLYKSFSTDTPLNNLSCACPLQDYLSWTGHKIPDNCLIWKG